MLDAWLQDGMAEQQTSFLLCLVLALLRLPFPTAQLAASPLVASVQRLASHG